ncbi:60 kDa lysophospholipase [Escovopsis weberi]|uniref:60 kDa lysophospholipase n=1 Tax=Escovopsis weberi TaxID=150374 RepID=A0A0M9VUY5_ESCWE|nr:60 kDa lysophospholipase [Escovopsis weberi]
MACGNTLEVFNLLKVTDESLGAKDSLGRVPLHYAATSGQVELVKVVLERSKRIGISVDFEDNDGWSPLLWATRGLSRNSRAGDPKRSQYEVIQFLIKGQANVTKAVKIAFGVWTALDIAYYNRADPEV